MARSFLTGSLLIALGACASSADDVCQNVGDCSYAGSYIWIQSCQTAALALREQAHKGGCSPSYDAYFACANHNYRCTGDTASFPGCDRELNALETCLNQASDGNACAQYQQVQAACRSATAAAGSIIPTSCTLALQCQAQCLLTNVSNLCSPDLSQIAAAMVCAQSCP